MVYEWKTASRIRADANDAGAQFEQLEKTVGLTPKTVLDANRDINAPLHNEFEWDDTVAAENYRLGQAGHLIRCLCVAAVAEDDAQTAVRAFFTAEKTAGYESVATIMQCPDKRESLLKKAEQELDAYLRKYSALSELDPIRRTVPEVFERRKHDTIRKSRSNIGGALSNAPVVGTV